MTLAAAQEPGLLAVTDLVIAKRIAENLLRLVGLFHHGQFFGPRIVVMVFDIGAAGLVGLYQAPLYVEKQIQTVVMGHLADGVVVEILLWGTGNLIGTVAPFAVLEVAGGEAGQLFLGIASANPSAQRWLYIHQNTNGKRLSFFSIQLTSVKEKSMYRK